MFCERCNKEIRTGIGESSGFQQVRNWKWQIGAVGQAPFSLCRPLRGRIGTSIAFESADSPILKFIPKLNMKLILKL